MITPELVKAISQYAESMSNNVSLVLQTGEHSKRQELVDFLSGVASATDKIEFVEKDLNGDLRSAISFRLEVDGKPTGIEFSGIPGGHEFNSLILAILNAGGSQLNLDDAIKSAVESVSEPLHFEVFISLSCHNCPDVVQTLNKFALVNPHIKTEMIDGGLYQNVIDERDIQGVPCVYANGELFANGKIDAAQLFSKLQEKFALSQQAAPSTLPLQDVTVIGGGPAGVAAAIYSARKGLNVTIVADRLGGQLNDTMGIENFISTVETTGAKLTGDLKQHMNTYDVTVKEGLYVESISDDLIKGVSLSSGEVIHSKTVIVATGARWRELGVPGEKENVGNGVAYCPHCDGPFFKGKDVAVVGGGNSGIEAALDLSSMVRSVKVFEFMPELKADQVLVEKAQGKDNIEIHTNVAVEEITAESGKVNGLQYQSRSDSAKHTQSLHGVFVQIGLVPNSQFLEGVVTLSKHNEVEIDERCKTSVEGIYACGDVTTVPYKQIIVAAGEGAKASLSAFEYLLKESDRLDSIFEKIEVAA